MLGKWQRSLLSQKPGACPAEVMGPCQCRSNYGPCSEVPKNFICLWLTCLFPGVMLSVCVRKDFFSMSLKSKTTIYFSQNFFVNIPYMAK